MKFTRFFFLLIFTSIQCFAQLPWEKVYSGSFKLRHYKFGSSNNGYVYAFSTSASNTPFLLRSNANGANNTWSVVTLPAKLANTADANVFCSSNEADIYIVTSNTMWWSGDYGNTWQELPGVPHHIVQYAPFEYLPYGNVVLSRSVSKELYRSIDNGHTWTSVLKASVGKIIHKGADTYAFTDSTVYKSNDLGVSWTNLNATLPYNQLFNFALLSNDRFLTAYQQGIYTSADAITWAPKNSTGLPSGTNECKYLVKAHSSDSLFSLWYDFNNGPCILLYSADSGATWGSFDTGLPATDIYQSENLSLSANGYFFTSGLSGNIYRTSKPITLSVANTPDDLHSLVIYPNPVSNRLVIEKAPKGSCLAILNVMGQQVYKKVILNEKELVELPNISTGNYWLRITSKEGACIIRNIVKQ